MIMFSAPSLQSDPHEQKVTVMTHDKNGRFYPSNSYNQTLKSILFLWGQDGETNIMTLSMPHVKYL